jgi:hypothetical protein
MFNCYPYSAHSRDPWFHSWYSPTIMMARNIDLIIVHDIRLEFVIPDDGGSTYLWNVGRQLFYTVVHPRRQFWTLPLCFIICFRGLGPDCHILVTHYRFHLRFGLCNPSAVYFSSEALKVDAVCFSSEARRYSSCSFTTTALDRGEWSASRPGPALTPGKETPVPTGQEDGWAPELVSTQATGKILFAFAGDSTSTARSSSP